MKPRAFMSFIVVLISALMAVGISVTADKSESKPPTPAKPGIAPGRRPDSLARLFPGPMTSLNSRTMNFLSLLPAATINVNTTAQSPGASGDCTLGEAIQAANTDAAVDGCTAGSSVGADTIMLPAGTYTLITIGSNSGLGPSGLPGITSDIVIQGAGSATTIIERAPSAAAQFRLLAITDQNAGSIVLNDLTMRLGRSVDEGGALNTFARPATLNRVVFDDNRAQSGGAVISSSQGGVLVANGCTFTNNQATSVGGALVAGVITLTNSSFTGNSAIYGGALDYIQGGGANFNITDSTFTNNQAAVAGGFGGAMRFDGTVTITRTSFTGNSSAGSNGSGGAIAGSGTLNLIDSVMTGNMSNSGGGIHFSNGSFNISGSTISNNVATTHFGGGIYLGAANGIVTNSTISGNTAGIDGGGIWLSGGNATLVNVTIDGNIAGQYGGGILFQSSTPKTLALNNATLTGNRAGSQGGGLLRFAGDANVTTKNSIIALNTSDINNAPDIYSTTSFTSLGYNLVGIKDGANFTNAVGDQTGTTASPINPLLGPLQNNGGPTFTRALLPGSPALDAANPAAIGTTNSCEPTDQRGVSRPQDGDNNGVATCDIGAYEQIRVPVCIPPPSSMVAWWPFDGNANDIQGGNHATLIGDPIFATGRVDQGLTFDGIDDHAVIPVAAAFDIGAANGMTFDMWINPPEVQTARPLIEWGSGIGPHLWMSADFGEGGQGVGSLFVNLPDTAGSYHIFSSGPGLLVANVWQHVAVTYDKTSGIAKIYLNGASVAQQTLGSFTPRTATDLYLGYRPAGVLAGRRFLGTMDEVELFNRALDATEIQAIYYADVAGKCKPAPTPTPTPTPTPAVINITEQITVTDTTTLLPSAMIGINENISVHDTPSLLPAAMIGINETISVHDTPALQPSAMIGVIEQINVRDAPGLVLAPMTVSLATPTGTNVTIGTRAVTISFANVTVAGTTTITPIDPAAAGQLPGGYQLAGTSNVTVAGTKTLIDLSSAGQLPGGYQLAGLNLAFDISTTATFSGPITICFNVNSATDPAFFATLNILHNENGTLVDRTTSRTLATRTICATVNSLSRFVLAQSSANPLEDPEYFVRQHYLDFLAREPDESGLQFWTDQIASCGSDAQCIEVRRINVSAAYFLSIEFQETGYLVYRFYNAALNRSNGLLRYQEFLSDSKTIGHGVVVGAAGWEAQLEASKVAFAGEFVTRAEFTSLYPPTQTPAQFVDALYAHAVFTPTASERQTAIGEFGSAATSADTAARGRVLRRVAENQTLGQREFNRAFVLMQYFGYLRRNPDDAPDNDLSGYNFWLNKLNQFNGNFINAEMVKAFIVSGEYRNRFGMK